MKKDLPLKISLISYANTWPFLDGIKHFDFSFPITIKEEYPAQTAISFQKQTVDVALIPVAALLELKDFKIFSDYCIGSHGKVDTVMLHSHVPKEAITKVWLDYQSRTSVKLVQILAENYWKISPQWKAAEKNYEQKISGTIAGVIIGDRNFSLSEHFPYSFDLSEEWKNFTGHPFVFAVWVAQKHVPDNWLQELNAAFKQGLDNLPENGYFKKLPEKEVEKIYQYLTERIDYSFDHAKQKALQLFFDFLAPEPHLSKVTDRHFQK